MYEPLTHTFQTPHGNPIVMSYRDETNDWNTLTATLTEDEYGLPSDLEGVALDIGGYLGSVGIALALDNPGLRVIIVEPVPLNVELIKANIKANDVGGRVHLIKGAVGRLGETVEVVYGFAGNEAAEHHAFVGNSSLVIDAPTHETVTYTATALELLVALAGDMVPWMKIDTEGAEYAFLDSPAIGMVGTIVGEWHDGRSDDLQRLLRSTHLVVVHHYTLPDGTISNVGAFEAYHR